MQTSELTVHCGTVLNRHDGKNFTPPQRPSRAERPQSAWPQNGSLGSKAATERQSQRPGSGDGYRLATLGALPRAAHQVASAR